MAEETIDITPDTEGLIRWARTVLREASADSKDAEIAHKVLAECGAQAGTTSLHEFLITLTEGTRDAGLTTSADYLESATATLDKLLAASWMHGTPLTEPYGESAMEILNRVRDAADMALEEIALELRHMGAGYTSFHTTAEGAERRLHEKIEEWGLQQRYESDSLEYGISHLPVEGDEA